MPVWEREAGAEVVPVLVEEAEVEVSALVEEVGEQVWAAAE